MAGAKIAGLRNLGPKSAEMLESIGVRDRSDLANVGAVEACRQILETGQPVSLNLAYAIEGALMDCDWRAIPFDFRKHLVVEFQKMKQGLKK